MSRIIPIPTTRVGDFFVRQRLIDQVQGDQLALFQLQNQISTGRRLQLPSDDAPAALRAINLQRLLDRKSQIKTNLQSNNFYLGAAETSLGSVSELIRSLRGEALAVSGTLADDAARQTVIQQVDQALESIVATANSQAQGRYLFAGSRSQTVPYEFRGSFVEYTGNEGVLRTYVDVERLFESNLAGNEVFGGISAPVEGAVNLAPRLTPDTLLSTINGGAGIGRNAALSVTINNGIANQTSIVDLSRAVTVLDAARMIEAGAPAGANVTVEITGAGLTVRTSLGTITIGEVAEGRTAHELGLFSAPGATLTDTITGASLSPALLKTTRLTDLLGTKAQGRLVSSDANNDITIMAVQNGQVFDGVTVEFVSGVVAGQEVAAYDENTKTLSVQIQPGFSTANQVVAAINAEGTFTAEADYHDATSLTQSGAGTVDLSNFAAITLGGSGADLDTESGIQLTNGGKTVSLDVSSLGTVEELLNRIDSAGIGLTAKINAGRTGINVRSRLSGADFAIGENGGTTAAQLGIRSYTGTTQLADLNRGIGVPTSDEEAEPLAAFVDNLTIIARNGTTLSIDPTGAASLATVIDRINSHPDNNSGGTAVLARLTAHGRGIELIDSSTPSAGDLIVQSSQAAEYLGFLSAGQPMIVDNTANSDGDYTLGSYRHSRADDLAIVARDGTELWIDLTGAKTVQDVIDRINSHPRNNTGGTVVEARLATVGNGIELVDASVGGGSLSIRAAETSFAAQYLGFLAQGQTQSDPADIQVDGDGNQVLTSEDRHTLETDSVFNTLLRLRSALQDGDVIEIGRSIERLDEDLERVTFAAAEIGTRLQNLAVIDVHWQDEDVQLRAALSDDLDADLVEAISNLTARQFAFEASLRTSASLLQISLLNFI